jgi:two-component system phosphate regulon sensor histidine kinase PhoR
MIFEWLAVRDIPYLQVDLSLPGYIITGAYALLTVVLWVRDYPALARFTSRRWMLLAALLATAPLAALSLVFTVETETSLLAGASLALLGLLPPVIAALWLGPGSAILVGFVAGLAWALFNTGRVTQPFEVALTAALIAILLNQRYRDRVSAWLRQPVIAAVLSALLIGWPLALLGTFATEQAPALVSLDRTLTAFLPLLAAIVPAALLAGGVVQLVVLRWPELHPAYGQTLQTSPWDRHLNQRMLFTLAPLAVLVTVVLVGVVAGTSYQVATRLVVEQMARDATNAGSGVPFFVQLGRSLIRDLAQDDTLATTDGDALQDRLVDGLRMVPFFQQLIYLDAGRSLLVAYPETTPITADLAPEEANRIDIALSEGAPAEVTFFAKEPASSTVMSFLAPVDAPQPSTRAGVLLGRTVLDTNVIITPVVDVLRDGFVGSGEGFIIDGQNTILLYPARPQQQRQLFSLGAARQIREGAAGQAFRRRLEDGTWQLVYILPISGRSDWSVVVLVPNEVVVALAVQIALPMLLMLLGMIAIAMPLAVAVTRRITVPLEDLLKAAELISEGQLDRPLHVIGEDEIGRLGRTFEQMRLSLKGRLSEQDRLLRVTRSVSSSLELFRAMPPILGSALDVTRAAGVRIALQQSKQDGTLQTYAAGESAAAMAPLDAQLIGLVQRQGTVVISQLERASGSLDVSLLPPGLRSLVAFPLRSDTSFYGILWLCYDHEHAFAQSELTFLSTLAGQTAVAVANSRLLTEAEDGRRQLEAVLESTADAMIVTDNQGKIVLINPAAERFFGVRGDLVRAHSATEVVDSPELAKLLTDLQEPVAEFELPDRRGKTLLANTSTIVSHDGTITGRVAVLRDITALKELDSIKTVFLQMVSHDLRSPLTYMRGYLSMLPLAGDLNQKQEESLAKVHTGIEHISELTERLLYLSRLQFGDEAELDLALVGVEDMIHEILQQQEGLVRQKEATVEVEAEADLPLVLADGVLYRQAVMNLINNALKYAPDEGGKVTLRAYHEDTDGGKVTVAVTDNGMGIREEDQARLFEAFYRVPHREGDPKRPRGSGLGLALVKAIAQAHDGQVGVESEFGKGSTFWITLPLRDPADT